MKQEIIIQSLQLDKEKEKALSLFYQLINTLNALDKTKQEYQKIETSISVAELLQKIDKSLFLADSTDNITQKTNEITIDKDNQVNFHSKQSGKTGVILNRAELFTVNDMHGDIVFNEYNSIRDIITIKDVEHNNNAYARLADNWISDIHDPKYKKGDYWFVKRINLQKALNDLQEASNKGKVISVDDLNKILAQELTPWLKPNLTNNQYAYIKNDNNNIKFEIMDRTKVVLEDATDKLEGIVQFAITPTHKVNLIVSPSLIAARITVANKWLPNNDGKQYIASDDGTNNIKKWVEYDKTIEQAAESKAYKVKLETTCSTTTTNEAVTQKSLHSCHNTFLYKRLHSQKGEKGWIINIDNTKAGNPYKPYEYKKLEDTALYKGLPQYDKQYQQKLDKNAPVKTDILRVTDNIEKYCNSERLYKVQNNNKIYVTDKDKERELDLAKYEATDKKENYLRYFQNLTVEKLVDFLAAKSYGFYDSQKNKVMPVRAVMSKTEAKYKINDLSSATRATSQLTYTGLTSRNEKLTAIAPVKNGDKYKLTDTAVEVINSDSSTQTVSKESALATNCFDTLAIGSSIKSKSGNHYLYIKNLANNLLWQNPKTIKRTIFEIESKQDILKSFVSPSGKLLLNITKNTLKVYETATGKEILKVVQKITHNQGISATFSSDDNEIAIGTDRELIWIINPKNKTFKKVKSQISLLDGLEKANDKISANNSKPYSWIKAHNTALSCASIFFLRNRRQIITACPATASIEVFTYLKKEDSYKSTQIVSIKHSDVSTLGSIKGVVAWKLTVSDDNKYLTITKATTANKVNEEIYECRLKKGNKPIQEILPKKPATANANLRNIQKKEALYTTEISPDKKKVTVHAENGSIELFNIKKIQNLDASIKKILPFEKCNLVLMQDANNAYLAELDVQESEKYIVNQSKLFNKTIAAFKESTGILKSKDDNNIAIEFKDTKQYLFNDLSNFTKSTAKTGNFDNATVFNETPDLVLSLDPTKKILTITGLISKTITLTNYTFDNSVCSTSKDTIAINVITPSGTFIALIKPGISDDIQLTAIKDATSIELDKTNTYLFATVNKTIEMYKLNAFDQIEFQTVKSINTDIKKVYVCDNDAVVLQAIHDEKQDAKDSWAVASTTNGVTAKNTPTTAIPTKKYLSIFCYRIVEYNYYLTYYKKQETTATTEQFIKPSTDCTKLVYTNNNNVIIYRDIEKYKQTEIKLPKAVLQIHKKIAVSDDLYYMYFIQDDNSLYVATNEYDEGFHTNISQNETYKMVAFNAAEHNSNVSCSEDGMTVCVGLPIAESVWIYDILLNKKGEITKSDTSFGHDVHINSYNQIFIASNATSLIVNNTKQAFANIAHCTTQANFKDVKIKDYLTTPEEIYSNIYSLTNKGDIINDGTITYSEIANLNHGGTALTADGLKKSLLPVETTLEDKDLKITTPNQYLQYQQDMQEREIVADLTKDRNNEKEFTNDVILAGSENDGNLGYRVKIFKETALASNPDKMKVDFYKVITKNSKKYWKLIKTVTGTTDTFGNSIALSKDYFVVGEPGANKAYLYDTSNANTNTLKTFSGTGDYGFTVSLNDETLRISASQGKYLEEYELVNNKFVKENKITKSLVATKESMQQNKNILAVSDCKTQVDLYSQSKPTKTGYFETKATKYDGLPDNPQGYTGYYIKGGQYQLVRPVGTTDTYTKYNGQAWVKNGTWGGVLWYLGSKIGFGNKGDYKTKKLNAVVNTYGRNWKDVNFINSDFNRIYAGSYSANTVTFYEKINNVWVKQKQQLTGSDRFGVSVDVSADGDTIVVGADYSSYIEVYEYKNKIWSLKGKRISNAGRFGFSSSISADGNIVASGGGESGADFAEVYEFIGGQWKTKGQRLTGAYRFGVQTYLSSNGLMLAVSSNKSQYVEVYEFINGQWKLKGQRINGGTDFGYSLYLSEDGSTLVISCHDDSYTEVYEFIGSQWKLKGQRINVGNTSVQSFDLSKTKDLLIIGFNDNNIVYIYTLTSGNWVKRETISGNGDFGVGVKLNKDYSKLAVSSEIGDSIYFYNINVPRKIYLNTADGKHYYNKKELKDDTKFYNIMETVAPLSSIPDPITEPNRNIKLTNSDIQEQPNKTGNYVSLLGTGTAVTPTELVFALSETIKKAHDCISMTDDKLLITSVKNREAYLYNLTVNPTTYETITLDDGYGSSCAMNKNYFAVGNIPAGKIQLYANSKTRLKEYTEIPTFTYDMDINDTNTIISGSAELSAIEFIKSDKIGEFKLGNYTAKIKKIEGRIYNTLETNLTLRTNVPKVINTIRIGFKTANKTTYLTAVSTNDGFNISHSTITIPPDVYTRPANEKVDISFDFGDNSTKSNVITLSVVATPQKTNETRIYLSGGYRIHQFKNSGYFNNSTNKNLPVQGLLVGAGGSAGRTYDGSYHTEHSGGGAGGDVIETSTVINSKNKLYISIGNGNYYNSGGNTTFNGVVAYGGGRGAGEVSGHGQNGGGGSYGGRNAYRLYWRTGQKGGDRDGERYHSGSGGGAGYYSGGDARNHNASSAYGYMYGGYGSEGYNTNFTGNNVYFGGGGGGGVWAKTDSYRNNGHEHTGLGGVGGGGNGGYIIMEDYRLYGGHVNYSSGDSGTNYTGGGAGAYAPSKQGATIGGSGIAYIKYKLEDL